MAVFDRLRRRMAPVGDPAAEGMNMADFDRMRRQGIRDNQAAEERQSAQAGMGALGPDGRTGGSYSKHVPMQPGMSEGDVELLTSRQSAEAAEAAELGRRMGAESLMQMAGMDSRRRSEMAQSTRLMNAERLNAATQLLIKYQGAKTSVNQRVVRAQQWWKLRNWEQIRQERGVKGATTHPSNTGWLWNCIVGKHADAIDSYPEPVILPRMQDDKAEATKLSKIVPVVMEMNDFEETYNDASWQKTQEGTAVYGVFWDSSKLNGLGDIAIEKGNMLNIYWEPGVNDIEKSRNVFYVSYEDKKELEETYPELQGKLNTTKITITEYKTDDHIDTSDKAAVIDWYYKKKVGGRTVLHYTKYVNETCLYSSEESGLENGYYEDGEYPFVLDPLFPVEGSCAGYGYIDIARDTQSDIDTLSQAMVQNAAVRAAPRYFVRKDGAVNEEEFADVSKPLVHVNGNLGQDSVRPIEVMAMGNDAHNMLQQKIDEIKFITGNTDINNGGVPSGVTAASAIAALKEDSGRSSKDSTKASYRAYRKVVIKVIERIRQFYDIPRQFRILGEQGQEQFVTYDNAGLQPQMIPNFPGEEPGMRLPIFDIEVRAQRENAYTKMSQNELALQFFGNGMLNPQMTDQALIALDMMDFRGKEELRKKIEQQGTMQSVLMQVGQIAMMLAQKYDPAIAQQLAGVMQGVSMDIGGVPAAAGGGINPQLRAPADNMSAPNPNENALVRRARERAANASRPE